MVMMQMIAIVLFVFFITGFGQIMVCEDEWCGFTMMGVLDRISEKRGSYFESNPIRFARDIAQEKWPLLRWEDIWWQDTVLFFPLWTTHFVVFVIPATFDALERALDAAIQGGDS